MAGTGFGQYIGTTTEGEVPNITGHASVGMYPYGTSGALYLEVGGYNQSGQSTPLKNGTIYFDASRVSNLYVTGATKVRAASLFMAYVIKY